MCTAFISIASIHQHSACTYSSCCCCCCSFFLEMSSCEFQILQSSCSSGLLLCLCLPLLDLLEAPVIVDFFVGRFCWRYYGLGRVRGFFNRTWCGWCLCTSRICLDMRRLCLLVMDLLAACVILLLLVLLWLVLEMFFWELRILRPSCSYGFLLCLSVFYCWRLVSLLIPVLTSFVLQISWFG